MNPNNSPAEFDLKVATRIEAALKFFDPTLRWAVVRQNGGVWDATIFDSLFIAAHSTRSADVMILATKVENGKRKFFGNGKWEELTAEQLPNGDPENN
jgi:hypothetical protein